VASASRHHVPDVEQRHLIRVEAHMHAVGGSNCQSFTNIVQLGFGPQFEGFEVCQTVRRGEDAVA
jgi:hypothetical protein